MSFADLVINKINGDFYIIFYIVLRITINEVENKMKLTIKKTFGNECFIPLFISKI
jgi:hypothetical protein